MDLSNDPPKMICLRRGTPQSRAFMATTVTDGRVKYGDDFDVENCTPKEKAAFLVSMRQRRQRAKKREQQEESLR